MSIVSRFRVATRFSICVGLALAQPALAQVAKPDLDLVNPGAFFFFQSRPAELWNGDLGAKLRKDFPREAEDFQRQLTRTWGVAPAEVQTVVCVGETDASVALVLGMGGHRRDMKKFKEAPFEKEFEKKDFKEDRKPLDKDEKKESPVSAGGKKKFDDDKFDKRPIPDFDDWKGKGRELMFTAGLRIITTVKPYDKRKVADVLLQGEVVERTVKGKTYFVSRDSFPWALHFMNDRTFVLANPPLFMEMTLERIGKPMNKGPLSPALMAAGRKHEAVLAFNFEEESASRIRRDLNEEFRRPWGREPVWALIPLLQMKSATFSLDLGKESRLQGDLIFPDAKRASNAVEATEDAATLLRFYALGQARREAEFAIEDGEEPASLMFLSLVLKQMESGLRSAKVKAEGAIVQVVAQCQLDVPAMTAKVKGELDALAGDETARFARQRRMSQNNLKQIGIALHNIHDVTKNFPPAAICDKTTGKPLLSWRVAILPYIEQQALYLQFKLDEPWDSAHNIKLLPNMPKVYAPIGVKTKTPHATFYQALTGPEAVFDTRLDKNAMFGARGIRIFEITDGTSNTIGVVEASDAVPWSKPEDLPYDGKKALPRIGGGQFADGFNALFMDASVRFLSNRVDQQTLRALITRAGGEAVNFDKFER